MSCIVLIYPHFRLVTKPNKITTMQPPWVCAAIYMRCRNSNPHIIHAGM